MTWVSYHFRSSRNHSQIVPTRNEKLTRPEDASVLVIERSKTNREADRQTEKCGNKTIVSVGKEGKRKEKKNKPTVGVEVLINK